MKRQYKMPLEIRKISGQETTEVDESNINYIFQHQFNRQISSKITNQFKMVNPARIQKINSLYNYNINSETLYVSDQENTTCSAEAFEQSKGKDIMDDNSSSKPITLLHINIDNEQQTEASSIADLEKCFRKNVSINESVFQSEIQLKTLNIDELDVRKTFRENLLEQLYRDVLLFKPKCKHNQQDKSTSSETESFTESVKKDTIIPINNVQDCLSINVKQIFIPIQSLLAVNMQQEYFELDINQYRKHHFEKNISGVEKQWQEYLEQEYEFPILQYNKDAGQTLQKQQPQGYYANTKSQIQLSPLNYINNAQNQQQYIIQKFRRNFLQLTIYLKYGSQHMSKCLVSTIFKCDEYIYTTKKKGLRVDINEMFYLPIKVCDLAPGTKLAITVWLVDGYTLERAGSDRDSKLLEQLLTNKIQNISVNQFTKKLAQQIEDAILSCNEKHQKYKQLGYLPLGAIHHDFYDSNNIIIGGNLQVMMWPQATSWHLSTIGLTRYRPAEDEDITIKFNLSVPPIYQYHIPEIKTHEELYKSQLFSQQSPSLSIINEKDSKNVSYNSWLLHCDWQDEYSLDGINVVKECYYRKINKKLSNIDLQSLYNLRHNITEHPEMLSTIFYSIPFQSSKESNAFRELVKELDQKHIPIHLIMELLDYEYPDPMIRNLMGQQLVNFSPEQLQLFHLQLVQILKFERSPNLMYQLINISINNFQKFGFDFYWALKSEMYHTLTYTKLYMLIAQKILSHISEDDRQQILISEQIMGCLKHFSTCVTHKQVSLKNLKTRSKQEIIEMLHIQLWQYLKNLNQELDDHNIKYFKLPLDYNKKLYRFIPKACQIMDSKKLPFILHIQLYQNSRHTSLLHRPSTSEYQKSEQQTQYSCECSESLIQKKCILQHNSSAFFNQKKSEDDPQQSSIKTKLDQSGNVIYMNPLFKAQKDKHLDIPTNQSRTNSKESSSHSQYRSCKDKNLDDSGTTKQIDVYAVMFKIGDDLRQDALVSQCMHLFKSMFEQNHMKPRAITYKAIPTEPEVGLIEIIGNSLTLAQITKQQKGSLGAFSKQPIHLWLIQQNNLQEYIASKLKKQNIINPEQIDVHTDEIHPSINSSSICVNFSDSQINASQLQQSAIHPVISNDQEGNNLANSQVYSMFNNDANASQDDLRFSYLQTNQQIPKNNSNTNKSLLLPRNTNTINNSPDLQKKFMKSKYQKENDIYLNNENDLQDKCVNQSNSSLFEMYTNQAEHSQHMQRIDENYEPCNMNMHSNDILQKDIDAHERDNQSVTSLFCKKSLSGDYEYDIYNPASQRTSYEQIVYNFQQSVAFACVTSYLLGLADRHNDNVMLKTSGQFFHIDFGHFLGNVKYKLGVRRERAPVFFTPDMAYVMRFYDKILKQNSYQQFEESAGVFFMAIRKYNRLFIAMFRMLLATGIKELANLDDLIWFVDRLNINVSDEEAKKYFLKQIYISLHSVTTKVNNFIHIIAHKQKGDDKIKNVNYKQQQKQKIIHAIKHASINEFDDAYSYFSQLSDADTNTQTISMDEQSDQDKHQNVILSKQNKKNNADNSISIV